MEPLDPDDPRPPFQQIANALRASIRTRRFQPGEQLPTLNELSKGYRVSLMTVQKAVGILRDEGLVISRQGKGSYVRQPREGAVGLRSHVEQAFEREQVTIDFVGFTGETLASVVQEPFDKIQIGRLTPESITFRILLPDLSVPVGLPALASTGSDDERVRARVSHISDRVGESLVDAMHELAELQLVHATSIEIRYFHASPLFKLFILNGEEAFFGFYPVAEHKVLIDREPTTILDLMGKDATLLPFVKSEDDSSTGNQYVSEVQKWFDSVWQSVAQPRQA